MIIWRGWGILGLLPFAAYGLGVLLWTQTLGYDSAPWLISGPLIVLVSVGVYALGQQLNRTGVEAAAHRKLAERRAEQQQLVDSGQFHLGANHPRPQSLPDAQAQADDLYAFEHAYLCKTMRNRHSLFFIPLQYVGIIAVVIGLIVTVAGLIERW